MLLVRNSYLDRIRPYYESNLIKVLVGPRRSGKSEIMKMIEDEIRRGRTEPAKVISINFEDLAFDRIRTYRELNQYVLSKVEDSKARLYLFLDEVQHVEEFERALASFKATLNCSIFITGSDSKILEGTLSTLLTGRTVQFKVYPFSYREALDFSRMEGKRVPEDFFKENYLKYGGYPQRFDYEDEEGILGYLNDLYRFVVEKDVFLQHKRLDKAKFAILSSYMLKHCGKPFSPDSIWRYYKGNEKVSLTSAAKNTIYSYVDIMKRCFFLQEEKEDRIEGREALRGLKKFYAYDNGMRIIQSKSNGWEKGFFLENIIYNECASRGYQIFYKEVKGRDLDLVLYKDGKKCYIQVCYSLLSSPKALKREYEALEKIKDNYPKFILSLDRERDSPFPLSLRGIRQIHVEDYLLGKEDIQLG